MRKRKTIIGLILTTVMAVSAVASSVPVRLVTTHGEGKCYGTDVSGTAITVSSAGVTVSGAAVEVTEGAVEVTGDAAKIASLHERIVNAATNEVYFSYIYFGSYPQSEVTGEALTQEIIEAEYVSGEAVVAGERYRRISRDDARTFEEWKEKKLADYPVANDKEDCSVMLDEDKNLFYNWDEGGYRYFRYEPIRWKVHYIRDQWIILVSEMVLDVEQYHKDKNVPSEYNGWFQSSIRQWLNARNSNGFAGMAFNEEQWEAIVSSFDTKIGLASGITSGWQVQCPSAMAAELTDYAFAKGGMKQIDNSMFSEYWLQNYGHGGYFAGRVSATGRFGSDDITMILVDNYNGVVPRIYLDITKTEVWELAGADPIQMEPLLPIASREPENSSQPKVTEKPSDEPEVTTKPAVSPEPSMSPIIIDLMGDVNRDGKVELDDAQLTLRAALKIEILSEEQIKYGDMDKNQVITLGDAQTLLKIALKIIDERIFI